MTRRAAIQALAEPQLGLFTWTQACEAGIKKQTLYRLVDSGEIQRLHHRVYRLTGVPQSFSSTVLAAVLATGPTSVASHATAALLHGIRCVPPTPQHEICAVGSALPLLDGVTVHRTRRLDGLDITVVNGVPVTTGARTVVDLAGRLTREELPNLVDEAICRRTTSRWWLYRRASELQIGRPRVDRVVRLTAPGAEGEFWSWLERKGNWVLRNGGLPEPEWNVKLFDDGGRFLGIVDAFYAWARVILQFDGLQFHRLPEQRQRDVEQGNWAALGQYCLLRFTWRDVVERPEYVVTQVRLALTRRCVG